MASRSYRVALGASKLSDVTEAANAPSGDFVEVRMDEAISADHDKLIQALMLLERYIQQNKRLA